MNIEIHYSSGDWAALYVDGKLEKVGDAYIAEMRAFELTGVKVVSDDAFMRGQSYATGVAQTLDEIEAYVKERDEAVAQATELRRQANELLAKAMKLDKEGRGVPR